VKKHFYRRKAFEQPGLADYKKLTWHELVIQSKTSTWSATIFKKHMTLMSSKSEPVIGHVTLVSRNLALTGLN